MKVFFSFRDSLSRVSQIVLKLRILLPAKCGDGGHVAPYLALNTEVFPVTHLILHGVDFCSPCISTLLCPGSPITHSGLLPLRGCFPPVVPQTLGCSWSLCLSCSSRRYLLAYISQSNAPHDQFFWAFCLVVFCFLTSISVAAEYLLMSNPSLIFTVRL